MFKLSNSFVLKKNLCINNYQIKKGLLNIKKYPKYLYFCKETKILKKYNENLFDYDIVYGNDIFNHNSINRVIVKENIIKSKLIKSSFFSKLDCKWIINYNNINNSDLILNVDFCLKNEFFMYYHLINSNTINLQINNMCNLIKNS